MNRNKLLIKNTVILAIGALVPKFIALITLPIVTSALSTDEYGIYDMVLTVASIFIPVATLQIQQASFRFLINSEGEKKKAYISSTGVFLLITMGAVAIIGFISLVILKIEPFLAIGICLMMFFEACYIVLGQILRGVGKTSKYTIGIILYAVLNLLFIFVFIVWIKASLYGIIYSMLGSYMITSAYMVVQPEIRKNLSFRAFSLEALKDMLGFSAPIVPSSISLWIVNLSDRLVVTAFLGVGMNGIYSIANKIPQLYSTGYNIFNMAWTESAARASDDSDAKEYYSKMFEMLFDFLIGLMLCLIAVTPLLFSILIDAKYSEAYFQMPILFFGVFFNSLVSFYGSIYIALKNTKNVATTSVIGAVINLIINLCFVKVIGLYAASISTVISYVIITIFRGIDLNKMIKIKYQRHKIILGLSLLVIASILCYIRTGWAMILCIVVALIFNLKYNLYLVKGCVSFIKNKIGGK